MTDRELITAVLRIQEFRGWGDPRLASIMGMSYATWYGLLNRANGRIKPRTRAKLRTFVSKWSDNRLPSPLTEHQVLLQKARFIQEQRGWSTHFCSGLAGVAWNTWKDAVCDGVTEHMSPAVKAKVEAFVNAWSDETRPAPSNVVPSNNRPRVTAAVRLAIVTSPKPHAAIGAELGLSLSTVYRVRLRERVMRKAS